MKHKFLIPVLALLFALPDVFCCWVSYQQSFCTTFNSRYLLPGTGTSGDVAGLLLNADSQQGKWKILFDDVERATIYVSISDVLMTGINSGPDSETGETVYSGGTSQKTTWDSIYIYAVTNVDGDTVTVGSLIRTIPVYGTRISASVSSSGTSTGTVNEDLISPATGAELVAGYDRVLCSLTEIEESTVTLDTELFREQYAPTGGFVLGQPEEPRYYEAPMVTKLLIEKIDSASTTTVTTMDFSDCSLSMPGTELPFTPRAVIGSVEVTKTKYNNASTRYRLRSAVQDQIMVVSNSSGGSVAETQTYTAPVTAAALVVTDSELQSDTFHAPAVTVSADSQPIWGRYSIDPVGLVVGDELTCRLVLTADGIDSDSADGELLIITPPANATQSITVTGVNRPER